MKKLITLSLLLASLHAADRTVGTSCSPSCTYSTIQAAYTAAASGDTITLHSGETFTETVTGVIKTVKIRPSGYRSLPPHGVRVPDTAMPIMPTWQNATSSQPALWIGFDDMYVDVNGVNTTTGEFTFVAGTEPTGFAVDWSVHCMAFAPPIDLGMPGGMTMDTRYWVKTWNSGTHKATFSLTQGGSTFIPSTAASGANSFYRNIRCQPWSDHQPDGIEVSGINFQARSGVEPDSLIKIGGGGSGSTTVLPANIKFHHNRVSGLTGEDGPVACMSVAFRDSVIEDNVIDHCKKLGAEGKAITTNQMHNVTIQNNQVSGAASSLFFGGSLTYLSGLSITDVTLTQNYIYSRPYFHWRHGTGAPTVGCIPGNYYHRDDNSTEYTCTALDTWTLGATWTRTQSFAIKNCTEIKLGLRFTYTGNTCVGMVGGNAGGQGMSYSANAIYANGGGGDGPGTRVWDITYRNNSCISCYSGPVYWNDTSGGITPTQTPVKNISVYNMLTTGIGDQRYNTTPASLDNTPRQCWSHTGSNTGVVIDHVTCRGTLVRWFSMQRTGTWIADRYSVGGDSIYRNNLASDLITYHGLLDTVNEGCAGGQGYPLYMPLGNASNKQILNNVLAGAASGSSNTLTGATCNASLASGNVIVANESTVAFTSSTDSRLTSSSSYLASATDGKMAGADIDEIEDYTVGAVAGLPRATLRMNVHVIPGSTKALLTFRRIGASCTVTVFTNIARSVAHADTDNGGSEIADNRASSMVSGGTVYFVAGGGTALTAATQYWYKVGCGAWVSTGTFTTLAASGAAQTIQSDFSHPTAAKVAIEYSTAVDFSGSTTLTAVNLSSHKVRTSASLPAGVIYWRPRYLDSGNTLIVAGPGRAAVAP